MSSNLFLLHVQLSLFFDILVCMTTDLDKEEYVGGAFKHVILTSNLNPLLKRAREKLWGALRGTSMRAGTCTCIAFVRSLQYIKYIFFYSRQSQITVLAGNVRTGKRGFRGAVLRIFYPRMKRSYLPLPAVQAATTNI